MSEGSAHPGGMITIGGDLTVGRLGFGAMRLCGPGVWGEPDDPAAAHRVLQRAVDLGVTLIDTANTYGPEVNERQIAEALHPYPADLVIATKGRADPSWARPVDARRPDGVSARRLRGQPAAAEAGAHRPLPAALARSPRPPSRTRWARLPRCRRRERSGTSASPMSASSSSGRRAGSCPSPRCRTASTLPTARRTRWSAPVRRRASPSCTWYPLSAGGSAAGTGALGSVARRHGAAPAQVAIAWLLARAPVVLPIPGTSQIAHLEENVAAANLRLTADDLRALA